MRVFVARQPIFNRKEQVVAYELLYRESEENVYSAKDGDQATTDLVINSFLNIGIEKLTEGKRCFVNFTESLMFSNLPTSFNPKNASVSCFWVISRRMIIRAVKRCRTSLYR